jgi:glucosyl-dolichyl phosphate glucuronosyltransferase
LTAFSPRMISTRSVDSHHEYFEPVTIVVCAYTEERWPTLRSTVGVVQSQMTSCDELIVIVDYNESLLARCRDSFENCRVVPNDHHRGLSGARNTAIDKARGSVVIFIDDDAIPMDGWLDALRSPYADDRIYGVGGIASPRWLGGRPKWFPDEFLWVVGCSHRGMPLGPEPVRNLFGANMSFRKSTCNDLGGFIETMGRARDGLLCCEETEFAIRLTLANPEAILLFDPAAKVEHYLAIQRSTLRYFARRCWAEGISKAQVTRRVGRSSALSTERHYASRVLTKGAWRGLCETMEGDVWGAARSAIILFGLAVTSGGYCVGTLRGPRQRETSEDSPAA